MAKKKPALPWIPPSGSAWWVCEKGHLHARNDISCRRRRP